MLYGFDSHYADHFYMARSTRVYRRPSIETQIDKVQFLERASHFYEKINERVNGTSIKALIKRNKAQTQIAKDRHNKIIEAAKIDFLKFKTEILFVTGVSLYWGEGYKKGAHGSAWKAIDLANSDPDIIKVFIKFLKKYLNVVDQDISIQLIIAPNQDIDKAIEFWSKITKLDKNRFIKAYSGVSKSSKGIRDKNSLPNGTIHVRVNSVEKFFILIGWIECLKRI